MSNIKHYTSSDILSMIQSNEFADWYDIDFMDYIRGEAHAKSRDEVLKDIKEMLG
jgi:hypothetical protein